MGWIIIAMAMLASGVLGAFFYAWWHKKNEQAKRRIPRRWPLISRPMLNSKERRVWRWLIRSFHDHHVLIKVPVTRFTMPQVKDERQHWFQILNGVYATFTICTNEGIVVGCVDVPGPLGFSLSNQTLKHSLLSQCDLRYWVVDPDSLPNTDSIRATFLGEHASTEKEEESDRLRTESEFNETREHLKASLLRQRHNKSSEKSHRAEEQHFSETTSHDPYESQLSTSWGHDSFVSPLDSRYIDLH
jgi:hypothetical protein